MATSADRFPVVVHLAVQFPALGAQGSIKLLAGHCLCGRLACGVLVYWKRV